MARLNRIAVAVACLCGGVAYADPVSLIAGALSLAGFKTAAFVVSIVGSLLMGGIASNTAKRRQNEAAAAQRSSAAAQRSSYNAGLQDRNVTGLSAEAPWQVVYGNPAPVGGSLVSILSSGAKEEFKHLVIVFAAHECQAIDEIYLDGEPVGALDASGNCTTGAFFEARADEAISEVLTFNNSGTATASRVPISPISAVFHETGYDFLSNTYIGAGVDYPLTISGITLSIGTALSAPLAITVSYTVANNLSRVNIQKHLSPGGVDTVDAYLSTRVGAAWGAADKLSGYTYAVISLDQNIARFQGGPPNVTAKLRGKKVYDFRTATTVYSANPALCLADFILSEAGYDATLAQFDGPSAIAAANAADVQGFTCDGSFKTEQDRESTKQQLEDCFGATCHQSGGVWRIGAGAWTTPVMSLTNADMAGPIQITQASYTSKERFNTVRGKYINGAGLGVATDFSPWQNPAYVVTDGLVKVRDITLPFTKDHQRAQDLARMIVERSRGGLTIAYPAHMRAWPLQPGDRVSVTNAEFGWSAKTFRMTDWGFSPTSPVGLTLVEDVAAYYNAAVVITADAAPNTNLSDPYAVPGLLALSAVSGTSHLLKQADGTITTRILWTWLPSANNYVTSGGKVQRQWRLATALDNVWASEGDAPGDSTSAYQSGLVDGVTVLLRARFVNQLGIPGAWSTIAHAVIGKETPPPDVPAFLIQDTTLSWGAVQVPDLAGYQVRFNYGQNTAWGTAQPLHIGLITASPWTPEITPPGPITLLVKAQDTTGNQSTNAAVIFANLGDVIVDNLILTYDDKAAGFPGAKVGSTVISGNLLANDSGGLFWGVDGASFWGMDTAAFWPAASYLALDYITPYTVKTTEAGSRLTLNAAIAGDSYLLQYRFDTSGAAWGNDANFYWGANALPFWAPPGMWQSWPGELLNIPVGRIEFRVLTQAGSTRGTVTALALLFDVADELEEFNDLVINAAGTRLPVTKKYRSINNVSLTLQSSGTAVTVKTIDKRTTGPLVACFNSAGTQVAGLIDARIQGVKG